MGGCCRHQKSPAILPLLLHRRDCHPESTRGAARRTDRSRVKDRAFQTISDASTAPLRLKKLDDPERSNPAGHAYMFAETSSVATANPHRGTRKLSRLAA